MNNKRIIQIISLVIVGCYADTAYGTKPSKRAKNSIAYRQAQQVKALKEEVREAEQLAKEEREKELTAEKEELRAALVALKKLTPSRSAYQEDIDEYHDVLGLLSRAADGRENVTYALSEARRFRETYLS